MFEREGFVVLTKAQVKQLLKEVEQATNEAFQAGTKAGYADGKEFAAREAFDDGYEQGYADGYEPGYADGYEPGYADGYMDGTDEFGDDWDEGYAEGHEAGYIEAELRSAEAAAFSETPKIHSWTEGEIIG